MHPRVCNFQRLLVKDAPFRILSPVCNRPTVNSLCEWLSVSRLSGSNLYSLGTYQRWVVFLSSSPSVGIIWWKTVNPLLSSIICWDQSHVLSLVSSQCDWSRINLGIKKTLRQHLYDPQPFGQAAVKVLSFLFKESWEWRCRPYNFIKITYDISSNSQISLLPYGFSSHWPVDGPMWCPLDKENPDCQVESSIHSQRFNQGTHCIMTVD